MRAQVSMSSTSIVVKCLSDNKASNLPHGQITIGTLILQDCVVGLLFAFMPVLKHAPGQDLDRAAVLRLLVKCVHPPVENPVPVSRSSRFLPIPVLTFPNKRSVHALARAAAGQEGSA
jgi:hypothetical protein